MRHLANAQYWDRPAGGNTYVFFWRLAGRSAPTGLAIVHWIGCINAIKIVIFFPLNRILLYYPVGQKFARNRSISYGFRDIHTFSFSAKIQDGRQKWRKLRFFP